MSYPNQQQYPPQQGYQQQYAPQQYPQQYPEQYPQQNYNNPPPPQQVISLLVSYITHTISRTNMIIFVDANAATAATTRT